MMIEFRVDGCPSDLYLDVIAKWPYSVSGDAGEISWNALLFYCEQAWNMSYGAVRIEESPDGTKLMCFITGGWSDNEAVVQAMHDNDMLRIMRWYSSQRGGTTKYIMDK